MSYRPSSIPARHRAFGEDLERSGHGPALGPERGPASQDRRPLEPAPNFAKEMMKGPNLISVNQLVNYIPKNPITAGKNNKLKKGIRK